MSSMTAKGIKRHKTMPLSFLLVLMFFLQIHLCLLCLVILLYWANEHPSSSRFCQQPCCLLSPQTPEVSRPPPRNRCVWAGDVLTHSLSSGPDDLPASLSLPPLPRLTAKTQTRHLSVTRSHVSLTAQGTSIHSVARTRNPGVVFDSSLRIQSISTGHQLCLLNLCQTRQLLFTQTAIFLVEALSPSAFAASAGSRLVPPLLPSTRPPPSIFSLSARIILLRTLGLDLGDGIYEHEWFSWTYYSDF